MGNDLDEIMEPPSCCGGSGCFLCADLYPEVQPSAHAARTCAQPAPALPDTPERMHGKDGENSNALEGRQIEIPGQDAIACLDCAEIAEFVTFSDPPIAKCFRCALLKAMNRMCALCGRHPVECIVRAVGENERQDVIGICANCFSKRLSGMRN